LGFGTVNTEILSSFVLLEFVRLVDADNSGFRAGTTTAPRCAVYSWFLLQIMYLFLVLSTLTSFFPATHTVLAATGCKRRTALPGGEVTLDATCRIK
jgi:hypothetical protein